MLGLRRIAGGMPGECRGNARRFQMMNYRLRIANYKAYRAIKLTGLPKQDAGSLMAFSLDAGSTAVLLAAPLPLRTGGLSALPPCAVSIARTPYTAPVRGVEICRKCINARKTDFFTARFV